MDIKEAIDSSIKEFNKSQDKFKIQNIDNFELIGQNSTLDSMAIVNFLMLLEKKLLKDLNIKINLMDKVFLEKKEKLNIKDLVSILES
tara:strand:- start:875 stop:1138 length:264 start_codon:yes stop_codon:yes gene_type:complete